MLQCQRKDEIDLPLPYSRKIMNSGKNNHVFQRLANTPTYASEHRKIKTINRITSRASVAGKIDTMPRIRSKRTRLKSSGTVPPSSSSTSFSRASSAPSTATGTAPSAPLSSPLPPPRDRSRRNQLVSRPKSKLDWQARITPKHRKIEKTITQVSQKTKQRSRTQTRFKTESTEKVSGDRRTEKLPRVRRTEKKSGYRKAGEKSASQPARVRPSSTRGRIAQNPEKRSNVSSNGTRSRINTSTACVKEPCQEYCSPSLTNKNGIPAISPSPLPLNLELMPLRKFPGISESQQTSFVDKMNCRDNEPDPARSLSDNINEHVEINEQIIDLTASGEKPKQETLSLADNISSPASQPLSTLPPEDNDGSPEISSTHPQEDSEESSKRTPSPSDSYSLSIGGSNDDDAYLTVTYPPSQHHKEKSEVIDAKNYDTENMKAHTESFNLEISDLMPSKQDSYTPETVPLSEGSSVHSAVTKKSNSLRIDFGQELEQRRTIIKKQQERILDLRHAAKCNHDQDTDCPVRKDCAVTKQLWKHILKCSDLTCQVFHCISSRYILAHYHSCTDVKCEVCGPVRSRRNNLATIKNLRGSNISFGYSQSNVSALSLDKSIESSVRPVSIVSRCHITNAQCEASPVRSPGNGPTSVNKLRGSNISFGHAKGSISALTLDISDENSVRSKSMRKIEEV